MVIEKEARMARFMGEAAGADHTKTGADCPYQRDAVDLRNAWFIGLNAARSGTARG